MEVNAILIASSASKYNVNVASSAILPRLLSIFGLQYCCPWLMHAANIHFHSALLHSEFSQNKSGTEKYYGVKILHAQQWFEACGYLRKDTIWR